MMTEPALDALPDPPPARRRIRDGRSEAHRPLASDLPETAWYDAMRCNPWNAALEPLCRSADARTVAALLRHFQPAVFADFLIRCSHAHTIVERIAGQGGAHSELFDVVSGAPLKVMELQDMTGRLWRRFCRSRGIADLTMDPVPDFGVNWHAPFVPDPR